MKEHQPDHPAPQYLFELPEELIAQTPPATRTAARMLLVDGQSGVQGEKDFSALPGLLKAGDLLVLNDSRVLPARLFAQREDTGGRVELLLVEPQNHARTWLAMAKPARRLHPGVCLQILDVSGGAAQAVSVGDSLTVLENLGGGEVSVRGETDPGELAHRWGVMPLPPYIQRDFDDPGDRQQATLDQQRYQTVYATTDPVGCGSVAAPTAGLHFDEATLQALQQGGVKVAYVRLHVGPGTFRPPNAEQIRRKKLHSERFSFPASLWQQMASTRAGQGRVIAVGTTSLRVLETVARLKLESIQAEALEFAENESGAPFFIGCARKIKGNWEVAGATTLFLMPPDRVNSVDGLLTNFHLPGSSLLMLVASFLNPGLWPEVYATAVARRFKFYSYGDCMLILKTTEEEIGC